MPDYSGIVAVHFHGGFLDGQTTRSGDPVTGGIIDYWNAKQIYDVTGGTVGAFMSGVSPEGLQAMRDPGPTAVTVVLHHRYRVTASRVESGTMILDVSYEYAPA
jgi:hypothetical protein